MIGIYKIVNKKNKKIYIGQSNNIGYRKKRHLQALETDSHFNTHLQKAWNKYGKGNFKFEIIEECTINELDDKEKYWIKHYNSANFNYGYNMAYGGRDGSNLTEESKKKISETLKGHIVSEETRKKIKEKRKTQTNTNKGKKFSDEARQNISLAHIGIKLSEETKKKVSENNARYWLGKKRDIETIEKMKKKLKQRPMTQEWRKQLDIARNQKQSMYEIHKDIIPKIKKMMDSGATQKEISLKLNINYSTIRNIVRKCIRSVK